MVRSDSSGTLLVVEDDRALNGMLTELFTDEGYAVDPAYDGQQALHLGLSRSYDAAIIDRGLPAVEGAELVALLRSRGIDTPVLLLTARGSVADRVDGLDAGAQDYLVKPFEVPELLARVRALVRRPSGGATVRAHGWCLNRVTRIVDDVAHTGGVELSDREATLLTVLMSSPRRVFTRSQLLEAAFDRADSTGAVDTYVHYLRRKLGVKVVETVHGVGYRMGSR